MSAEFTATDLRKVADALAALAVIARDIGVVVSGYSGDYLRLGDHMIRITWVEEAGAYVAEWPDST